MVFHISGVFSYGFDLNSCAVAACTLSIVACSEICLLAFDISH